MFLKYVLIFVALISSLCTYAQYEILVPYRSGAVWGLADTNRQVVVEPKYDSIALRNGDPKGCYKVLKDGKYGVITKDAVIIPPSLNAIQYRYGFITDVFPSKEKSRSTNAVYYNLRGEKLFNDTIKYVRALRPPMSTKYLYSVVHLDGSKSVFAYDISQKVEWLFKNKSYNYLHTQRDGDKQYVFGENKNEVLDIYELVLGQSGEVVVNILGDSAKNDVLTNIDQEIYEDVEAEMDDYDRFSNLVIEMELQVQDRQYMFIKKALEGRSRYYRGRPVKDSPDTVAKGEVLSKRFEIVNYHTMVEGATNNYFYGNRNFMYRRDKVKSTQYIMYIYKKKIGVITALGNLPAEFDTVLGLASQTGAEPRFIVGQKLSKRGPMLYGVLSPRGDTIIPINKTNIEVHTNLYHEKAPVTSGYITTELSGKQSYCNSDGSSVLSNLDSIFPYPHQMGALILVKDGLYGYHKYRHHIDPVFNDIPVGFAYFKRYKVAVMNDRNYQFIGYGKLNGEVFYEK